MDNFQSSDLLVGNEPLKTKPELGIDPRLVGNRFVSSLALSGIKEVKFLVEALFSISFTGPLIDKILAYIDAAMAFTEKSVDPYRYFALADKCISMLRDQLVAPKWRHFGATVLGHFAWRQFDANLTPISWADGRLITPWCAGAGWLNS